jgi:hypothetical protein
MKIQRFFYLGKKHIYMDKMTVVPGMLCFEITHRKRGEIGKYEAIKIPTGQFAGIGKLILNVP